MFKRITKYHEYDRRDGGIVNAAILNGNIIHGDALHKNIINAYSNKNNGRSSNIRYPFPILELTN